MMTYCYLHDFWTSVQEVQLNSFGLIQGTEGSKVYQLQRGIKTWRCQRKRKENRVSFLFNYRMATETMHGCVHRECKSITYKHPIDINI